MAPDIIEQFIPGHVGRGRSGYAPTLIVLHVQDGYGNPKRYFEGLGTNGSNSADCTVWISQAGLAYRYIKDSDTPWTNGQFNNPDLTNEYIKYLYTKKIYPNHVSLTIEHEGKPSEGFTAAQVEMSAQVVAYWCRTFNIPMDRAHIVGHYQIDSVNRPYCPGPKFPWDKIITRVQEINRVTENPDGKLFTETGFWVVNYLPSGDKIGFYDYFKKEGLGRLGYPTSPAYFDDGLKLVVQDFERTRVEWHPENKGTPYEIQEGLLGVENKELKDKVVVLQSQVEDLKNQILTLQGFKSKVTGPLPELPK